MKKSKPLWKQGPQPKLTAYEKIYYSIFIKYYKPNARENKCSVN